VFVDIVPVQWSSKNCPCGTLKLKEVSVTKEVHRQMMIQNVIPAIADRFPKKYSRGRLQNQVVRVQYDNAPVHMNADEFSDVMEGNVIPGMTLELLPQPPNSPDLNVLDLCLFNSLQVFSWHENSKTLEELKEDCERTFWQMDPNTI